MQKWFVEPEGALDVDEHTSQKRELYLEQMLPVRLEFEAALEETYPVFSDMPSITLPIPPEGYQWVRHENRHCMIRHKMTSEHTLKLILFGPNDQQQINFLFQVDNITRYSFAHTKRGADPSRKYPMGANDYQVPGFDYTIALSNKKFNSHVKGHLIDHKDTMKVGPRNLWSTYDARNYIPEPPIYEWGMGIRNQAVANLRATAGNTAYSQTVTYPVDPLLTRNHTLVPEGGYFTSFKVEGDEYKRLYVFDVNWDEDLRRPAGSKVLEHATSSLTSSLEASPVVKVYSPEDSDRALRHDSRELNILASKIAEGRVKSRHRNRAEFFSRTAAADKEFEKSDVQFQAALSSDKRGKPPTSIQYVKRSLSYAEELQGYDVAKPLSDNIAQQGLLLFESKENDAAWGEEDIDSLTDHLRRLSHEK